MIVVKEGNYTRVDARMIVVNEGDPSLRSG
jgi:hypothetical protein